jgi:hypothetical protein
LEQCTDIKRIIGRGQTFKRYLKAFASEEDEKTIEETTDDLAYREYIEKTIDDLFYRKYGKRKYYFPLIITARISRALLLRTNMEWKTILDRASPPN